MEVVANRGAVAQIIKDSNERQAEVIPDFTQLMGTVNQAIQPAVKKKAAADQHLGYQDAVKFKTSISGLSGAEQEAAYDAKFQELASTSDSYRAGYQSIVDRGYAQAVALKEEQRVNADLNIAATSWNTIRSEKAFNPDLVVSSEQFVTDYAEQNHIPAGQVRDAVYMGSANYFSEIMASSNTPQELADVSNEWEQVKANEFASVYFRGSQSKGTQSSVNASDRSISNLIKSKTKEFQTQARSTINQAIGSDYSVPTNHLEDAFATAYPDELTRGNQMRAYETEYVKAETRRDFMATNSPEMPHGPVPEAAKDVWQQSVNQSALQSFQSGDAKGFIDTINGDNDFAKGAGDALVGAFQQVQTVEELTPIVKNMEVISQNPGGASALRQALSDDNYVDIMATGVLAQTKFGGDVIKARDYISQAKQNITKQAWIDSTFKTVQEEGPKLGSMANQYKSVMERLNNIDPTVASAQESSVRRYFEEQQGSRDNNLGDSVNINSSMAPDVFDGKALAPDKAFGSFMEKASVLTGGDIKSIVHLPYGKVALKDELGLITGVMDSKVSIDESNSAVIKEAGSKKQSLPVGEVVTSTAINIGEGYLSGIGRLGSRFGGYLADQWNKDVEGLTSVVDSFKENVKTMGAFFGALDTLSDTVPQVANNTFTPDEQIQVEEVVRGNAQSKNALKQVANATIAKGIIAEENPQKVGYDKATNTWKPYTFQKVTKSGKKVWEVDIGYGEFLNDSFASKEEAEAYIATVPAMTDEDVSRTMDNHITKGIEGVKAILANHEVPLSMVSIDAMDALVNMYYQHGEGGLNKYKNMFKSIKAGDKEGIARNARDSVWYRQTPKRADRMIQKLIK